jgi:hypothetical protein
MKKVSLKMTNEKKSLDILIGDDAFLDFFTRQVFQDHYVPRLKSRLKSYDIKIAYETKPERVIVEASKFDVVVTDLDYTGDGAAKQGYDVIDAVCRLNPKPLLILCTSCDRLEEISEMTRGKIDYHAGIGHGHKFDRLVDILTTHYQMH